MKGGTNSLEQQTAIVDEMVNKIITLIDYMEQAMRSNSPPEDHVRLTLTAGPEGPTRIAFHIDLNVSRGKFLLAFLNLAVGEDLKGKRVMSRIFDAIEKKADTMDLRYAPTLSVEDFHNTMSSIHFITKRGYCPHNRSGRMNMETSKIVANSLEYRGIESITGTDKEKNKQYMDSKVYGQYLVSKAVREPRVKKCPLPDFGASGGKSNQLKKQRVVAKSKGALKKKADPKKKTPTIKSRLR